MSNRDTVHELHRCFNERDWDTLLEHVSDECIYIDGQGQVLQGKAGFLTYSKTWAEAFSDGQITEERIYAAGATVCTEFVGRGTNDGALGPIPATNKAVVLPYCEIFHFDSNGRVDGGRAYYDTMGLMTQLGLAKAPAVDLTEQRTRTR